VSFIEVQSLRDDSGKRVHSFKSNRLVIAGFHPPLDSDQAAQAPDGSIHIFCFHAGKVQARQKKAHDSPYAVNASVQNSVLPDHFGVAEKHSQILPRKAIMTLPAYPCERFFNPFNSVSPGSRANYKIAVFIETKTWIKSSQGLRNFRTHQNRWDHYPVVVC